MSGFQKKFGSTSHQANKPKKQQVAEAALPQPQDQSALEKSLRNAGFDEALSIAKLLGSTSEYSHMSIY